MSDLHRYGFAYGHPRVPLPHGKDDDPARAQFLDELAALRRQGQRYIPTPSQSHNDASPRNEVYYRPSVPRSLAELAASGFSGIYCRVCDHEIDPEVLRKNRQATICSEKCRLEKERQRRARNRAAAIISPTGRECKVCHGPIPHTYKGRKVRFDCTTCSDQCRRDEVNRQRREREAARKAAGK